MTFEQTGGLAVLACAATYLFGFAFLVTQLAPLGYGTNAIDASAVVAFATARPGVLILFNSVIYILNAFALIVLVVALHDLLVARTPAWAMVTRGLGLAWAVLVLGAGMIGNVAVERAAYLTASDPDAAALWDVLHTVELGLGGGNEIAGGVWILLVSLAGLLGRSLGKVSISFGLGGGVGGLMTLVPSLGDVAGAGFGMGAIAWFVAVGAELVLGRSRSAARATARAAA